VNTPTQPATTQAYVSELETLDLFDEEQDQDEEYVNDSDDDDLDELRIDSEMEEIMHFVFGDESDDEPVD